MNLRDLISRSAVRENQQSLTGFQDRMNEFFDSFLTDLSIKQNIGLFNKFPPLSLSETDTHMIVRAEIPVLDPKDIKIDVSKNRLIISGDKKDEYINKEINHHICELSYGKFSRTLTLPFDIDPEKVKANLANGLLTVEILKPHSEQTQTFNVPITSEG